MTPSSAFDPSARCLVTGRSSLNTAGNGARLGARADRLRLRADDADLA